MPLIHLASRIIGTPLLIARPKLDVILSVLGSRIGLPDRDMAFPIPEPKQARAFAQSGIAVIPVFGMDLAVAFRTEVARQQRRSDGTVSLAGQRFEIPAAYRHLAKVYSPTITMGCVFKISCNGVFAGVAWALQDVFGGGSISPSVGAFAVVSNGKLSCIGSDGLGRLYPGWAWRHACTRATACGPR